MAKVHLVRLIETNENFPKDGPENPHSKDEIPAAYMKQTYVIIGEDGTFIPFPNHPRLNTHGGLERLNNDSIEGLKTYQDKGGEISGDVPSFYKAGKIPGFTVYPEIPSYHGNQIINKDGDLEMFDDFPRDYAAVLKDEYGINITYAESESLVA